MWVHGERGSSTYWPGWGASSAHVDAATTSVVGDVAPSAFAGERYDLHVQARDQFGANLKGGGAVFKAAVMDGDTVLFDAECDDNNDGTYVASFLPEVAGTYRCVTCLWSAALPTSLATQAVAQADRRLLRSLPTPPHGVTLPAAAVVHDSSIPFLRELSASVRAAERGTESGRRRMLPVRKRLAVSIDGKLIKGSPFDIKVRTDETVAGNCKALGAGLQGGCVGDRHAFTVQAVDGKGNARTIGGDAFRVTANGTPGEVSDDSRLLPVY
jgi:hypothetical protein